MESCNSSSNGITKQLPIGFRFRPTDEELLIHYLRRKVLSLPLPASIVPDHMDIFRTHPDHLPGDWKEKRYFFSKISGTKGNVVKRMDDLGGYWKVIGKSGGKVIILAPGTRNEAVIGLKRCLVFYQRMIKNSFIKTRWIMHEFRLLGTHTHTQVQMADWVVCRIYQKKKYQPKINHYGADSTPISQTNLMVEEEDGGTNGIGPPPQDCSSSGITEVCCNELDDDDEKEACSASACHLSLE